MKYKLPWMYRLFPFLYKIKIPRKTLTSNDYEEEVLTLVKWLLKMPAYLELTVYEHTLSNSDVIPGSRMSILDYWTDVLLRVEGVALDYDKISTVTKVYVNHLNYMSIVEVNLADEMVFIKRYHHGFWVTEVIIEKRQGTLFQFSGEDLALADKTTLNEIVSKCKKHYEDCKVEKSVDA
ncbi:MAG: hypothetical protein ACUZ8I_10440 [Candidatus Scalindua sp.]